ncbi:hypothetical protein AMJ47_01180 [Parcubacteria bacterium DG_72]|nr:MAG: hypothetical protein AMJ47_01180 [Parcubacteria bacterium DG_72]
MIIPLILILIVTIVLGVIVFKRAKEGKRKPDYKTLYIIGISWFPLGVVFTASGSSVGIVFSAIGLGFLAAGLMNRDKWEDAKPVSDKQKKHSIILLVLGAVVFLITLLAYVIRLFEL